MVSVNYSMDLGGGTVVINGLALNPNASKVLVGGRKVLKVLSIETDKFTEVCNLRARETLNLSYSATDVAWSPIEENVVASAATNGVVITWDLNKPGRNKQEFFVNCHTRTCNRITFHYSDSSLLLTGSQDGTMALVDMRTGKVGQVISEDAEISVRDVQFSPHQSTVFAAACEDGNIRTWDTRFPSRWEKRFCAHFGPAFAVDWHPSERWLATGGRDKMIRVFDTAFAAREVLHPLYTVQTIASTARVKWRPQKLYQLSSCAQLLDFSLNVWDIRRPYIPFAVLSTHKDVVTGIAWKGTNEHVVLTCGKDGFLYCHNFTAAERPISKISPVTINISPIGHVAHAVSNRLLNTGLSEGRAGSASQQPSIMQSFFGQPRSVETDMTSKMFVYNPDNVLTDLSMDWFIESAQCYRLAGDSVCKLFEHNASVASRLQRFEVAQTWRMLQQMCLTISTSPEPNSQLTSTLMSGPVTDHFTDNEKVMTETEVPSQTEEVVAVAVDKRLTDISAGISDNETIAGDDEGTATVASSVRHPSTEANPVTSEPVITASRMLTSCSSQSDVFFGDIDLTASNFDTPFDLLGNNSQDEWRLPTEAFEPHFDADDDGFVMSVSPTDETEDDELRSRLADEWLSDGSAGVGSETVSLPTPARGTGGEMSQSAVKQELLSTVPYRANLPQTLDFNNVIVNMIQQYASQNDVQMAVCVLLCLGDKFIRQFDGQLLEQWFLSYIDLLHSFELWTVAAEVIKLSSAVNEVYALSGISTRIMTSCTHCGKMLNRTGWLCDRYNSYVHTCSICHLPVKGLYIWCQGCAHGGHLEHIINWFATHRLCPSGCGHNCEYT